jgi:adenylate cyclase
MDPFLAAVIVVLSGLTLAVIRITRRQRRLRARSAGESIPKIWDITIVVTNLTGMVSIFEQLGDRAAADLLNRYFATMVPIVREHRGFLAKMIFDQLICWFGAFGNKGNHAESALRCVLAMQAAVDELNQRLKLENLPELSMRTGVATGGALVGDIGSAMHMEFTALGGVPNLAMRLESTAKALSCRNLISAVTFGRTATLFRFAPRGTHRLTAIQEIEIYELLESFTPSTPHPPPPEPPQSAPPLPRDPAPPR